MPSNSLYLRVIQQGRRDKFSWTQAQKDFKNAMHFQSSHNSNWEMTTMERLLLSTQQNQVEYRKPDDSTYAMQSYTELYCCVECWGKYIWHQLKMALQRAKITKDFSCVDLLKSKFKDIQNWITFKCEFTPYKFLDKTNTSNSVDSSYWVNPLK